MSDPSKYYETVFVEGLDEIGEKLDLIIKLLSECSECGHPKSAHSEMSGHKFVK